MRKPILFAATALIALTLSACAAGPGGTGGGSSTSGTTGTPGASASTRPPLQTTTPGAIAPTGTPVEVPPDRWDAIVADLTDRGVTATPELVSAEAVTFNDGSLGCASPGQSYTQAQVDGMRVVVTSDGKTYDYRFGNGPTPKLCTR
ncbi:MULTISPECIES: hypothetical protein [Microbacterium]|uniref:hypothetical protein n=1 Tax=Microbacterium TaxID=33882 RepID=UPI0019901698|nr:MULTISPECIES: hypothetical protein [Microbacterium]MBD3756751.1 hypothetical protein [Microbacterium sp.]